MELITQNSNAAENELKEKFEKLRKVITNREKELIEILQKRADERYGKLKKQSYQLQDELLKLELAISFTGLVFRDGNEVEIAMMKKLLMDRLKYLLGLQLPLEPKFDAYFAFDDGNYLNFTKFITNYGSISE